MQPCDGDHRARIVSEAFVSLVGLDDDTVVVRGLGGHLGAGALRVVAAAELRHLVAAGFDVMPEQVELAGQLLRELDVNEADLARQLLLT